MTIPFPRPALFRALGQRPFAWLWSGQTISRLGDHLYQIALAWWVLQKTGSATAMGTVLVLSFAPMLLFLLLGGVAGDRLPRVRLMLASDVVRGVIVLGIAWLAWTDRLEIWHLYVASALFGLADAFFQPAYSSLVPALLPADDLPSGNSLTSLGVQAGRIGGPALGAALVALGGTSLAFALNGASFFLSALCLLPLLRVAQAHGAAEASPPSNILADVRDGLRFVLATPWLWVGILVLALTNVTLSGPYSVALPFLVQDRLGLDVGFLGILYATFAVGYVISGVWLGRYTRFRHRALAVYLGLMGAGLGMAVLGLGLPPVILLLAALVNGAALEMTSLVLTQTFQEIVPGLMLGRVSSIDSLGSYGLLPVGFALAGWATDLVGPATVCLVGGGLTMIFALLGLAHPRVRALD